MRFLVDMNLATEVRGLAAPKVTTPCTSRELGLQELDQAVLAKAIADKRVVLTFDLDFADIAAAAGETRVAVILFRLRSARTARVVERLQGVLAAAAPALEKGAVVIVDAPLRANLGGWTEGQGARGCEFVGCRSAAEVWGVVDSPAAGSPEGRRWF